jgi:chromosome segregation ATPase
MMPYSPNLMLKHWLTIGSVAFLVSFVCAFPFNRDFTQSALIGVAVLPGVAASLLVRSRQLQRQLNRQVTGEKSRLTKWRQQGESLKQQLQDSERDRQSIELRLQKLDTLSLNLNTRIDRDIQHHAEIEKRLATTTQQYQEQQDLLTKLDIKILDKQACLLEIDAQIVDLQPQLNSIAAELNRKQVKLEYLESQLAIKNSDLAERDSLIQLARSEFADRQTELVNLESKLNEKQAILEYLESQLIDKNKTILESNRDPSSTDVKLESPIEIDRQEDRKVELDIENILLQVEPKPPLLSRNIDSMLPNEEWHHNFTDNPHLSVLQHIEKHGAIAESEISHKLNNPRSVRQFANNIEEYTQHLPFTIRVESSPQGNRYLKES